MKEEEIKKLNIYEKLSLITKEIGVVVKGLEVSINAKNKYKAVSERDILDAVKPIEDKYRVFSYPVNREIIDKDILVKESEYTDSRTDNTTITRTNTLFMRLDTTYRFVNLDKPEEFIDITTYGDGLDTGDKAPGKAMTYADKYALMKCYKISTGDDPDKEPIPESTPMKKKEEPMKATPGQLKVIGNTYKDDNLKKLLELNKVDKIEDLPFDKAKELVNKIVLASKKAETKEGE